ncbi:MAG: PD40 domain-containing protein [Leadbetterella sp.]|nr:PD40 domain-containing protein [Leadbetterella sp.]
MMKILFFVFCFQVISFAQNGTEIYLLEIQKSSNGFKTQNPVNISNRSGYDNQPSFHPTQSLIYFSSQKDGQTDIWSYNYDSKKLRQITDTEDSEYSPTVTPDQQFLSCIVQRKSNGDQDFVKFSIKKPEKSEIILESQKAGKIGYHAWSPDNELITFVLGEPNTLQQFDINTKKGTVLGNTIGRSLYYVSAKSAFSFVEKDGETWKIKLLNPKNQTISDYADALAESEQYNAWDKNGTLFGTKNEGLYFFEEKTKSWKELTLPSNLPRNKISRLAIKDQHLVLVINE